MRFGEFEGITSSEFGDSWFLLRNLRGLFSDSLSRLPKAKKSFGLSTAAKLLETRRRIRKFWVLNGAFPQT